MPSTRPQDPCRAHDAEVVLRWIVARGLCRRAEVFARFAARMAGQARPLRALDLLRKDGAIILDRGLYSATPAGKERASTPLPSLPVLPEPFTPRAGFFCQRLGTALTIDQCALRHRTRTDSTCSRNAEGRVDAAGCPVGAEATRRLTEYHARIDARSKKARAA